MVRLQHYLRLILSLISRYSRHNHRQHSRYREALGKVSNDSIQVLHTRSICILATLLNYSCLALSLVDISISPVDSASASKAIVVGDLNFDPLCPEFRYSAVMSRTVIPNRRERKPCVLPVCRGPMNILRRTINSQAS